MARQSYWVAGELFSTQKSLVTRIRQILHRYPDRKPLEKPDFLFMADLLTRHPDYEQKVGDGLAAIWTQPNPVYPNTRNFWLERIDGTSTDFSFMDCLTHPTHLRKFHRACRTAISPDIMAFKVRFFKEKQDVCCPFTGEALSLQNAHVDHAIPFASLVSEFIKAHQIEVSQVEIGGKAEDQTCLDRFLNPQLEQQWRRFHYDHAEFRVVSPRANLGILRRKS